LAYIISDEANPTNHPIFSLDTDLGSILLQLTDVPEPPLEIRKQSLNLCEDSPLITSVWKMFFDGASSREGVGVGVFLVSPVQEIISLSYKLEFEDTNNVAKYEALVLGLRDAKDMGIEEISVFGDAELIVHQIRNTYQDKHPGSKFIEMKCGTSLIVFYHLLAFHLFPENKMSWLILWLSQQAILESLCHLNSSMI
jgi:hypothetical protein